MILHVILHLIWCSGLLDLVRFTYSLAECVTGLLHWTYHLTEYAKLVSINTCALCLFSHVYLVTSLLPAPSPSPR